MDAPNTPLNTKDATNSNKRVRGKTEIKLLKDESKRQVTCSKRRTGLFKKASVLSKLCEAEIAIVTFTPYGRLSSFGSPSEDIVIDRYLTGTASPSSSPSPEAKAAENYHDDQSLSGRGKRLSVVGQLEKEKKQKRVMVQERKKKTKKKTKKVTEEDGTAAGFLWDRSISDMGLEELKQHATSMKELREIAVKKTEELVMKRIIPSSEVTRGDDDGDNSNNNNDEDLNKVWFVDQFIEENRNILEQLWS